MVQDLNQLATLAESFAEQRPRSNKDWVQLADSLDQEGSPFLLHMWFTHQIKHSNPGVNLWNMSGAIRKSPDDDGRSLVGARKLFISLPYPLCIANDIFHNLVRLAAFRLIEASLEPKPGIESVYPVPHALRCMFTFFKASFARYS